ncbi:hypothetical protein [Caballeronia sp. NCTM5]|uniref:hypothetical protein n=1 Tax=Caballeronia sp. NCTM5 TaxID=2921755 RepID=UPI0020293047|nr:hypothetical protein [Caballeronia sp. NCTM5]
MKITTLLFLLPLTAAAAQTDMPEITIAPATVAEQPSKAERAPTARGIDLVDGAIVCSSYDLAEFMYGQINTARHARRTLPPELRRQAALVNGYDNGAEPRLADYGCAMVPSGTKLSVQKGNFVPVVSGTLPDGRKFTGVTLPQMIER